jgi:hypothetical protein
VNAPSPAKLQTNYWQPKIPITDVGSHFNPQSYIRNSEAAFRYNSVTEFLYRWFEDGRVADRSKEKGKENR